MRPAKPHPARLPTQAEPLRSADDTLPATSRDTLRAKGRVLRLRPLAKATFVRAFDTSLPRAEVDALDAPAIAATGGRVRRTGIRLRFTAATGAQTVVADDTTDTPEAAQYRYWGAAPGLHQWVLAAGFWEGSGVVLIDQRTGKRTDTWGQPIASPDGRLFATASADLETQYNPNGIQLYQVTAQGPHLLWQRQFNYWEPAEVRWLDNHTLAIYQLEGPTGSERPSRQGWVRVDLTALVAQRPR